MLRAACVSSIAHDAAELYSKEGKLTIHNILQRIQAANRPIDLPPRMIGHNNAITPHLHALQRVLNTLYALDSKRFATADLLPSLDQPRHPTPIMRSSMPYVVDPLPSCLIWLCFRIYPCLFESLLEHWICQTQICANAVVEGIVARIDVVVAPAELPGIDG